MDLARFAIEKRVISIVSTLLILIGGYFSYTLLPRFEDPEFIIRQAQIITPYPGATAEEVTEEVTEIIEAAVQQLQGIDEVRSVSSPGLSQVSVEFTIAASPDYPQLYQRFAQLRAKVDDAQAGLPPNARPSIVFDDFGDVFALYFAVIGDGYTVAELHEYAKDLQRELVTVPGVSKVVLSGVQDEVIYVEYIPARLVELGLSPQQVSDLLTAQDLVSPAGSLVAGESRLALRPSSDLATLDAIGAQLITNPQTGVAFRLSDIATISRGLEEPSAASLFRDGHQAIGIGVSNTLGGNVVNMGEAVKARMDALISERPIGMEVIAISDQSVSVKTSVDGFVLNVVLALVIVVGTLVVFMGIRSGLLMGGILLVTVAGTLVGMYLYGLDMQRISLGALIIALGMMVDNAIVVVEGTLVRVQKGESPGEASQFIVNQTKWPLLGGTVVGFLAFSPIGFSPDNTGEYVGSLFWTITIALLFSWFVAIWLTPYYCTLLLKSGQAQEEKPENPFLRGYRALLSLAIQLRYLTILLVVGLFVSAVMLFSLVPPGFFPNSTRAQFVVDYFLSNGTDIATTEADLLEIEAHIREQAGVTGTNLAVGSGHLRFMLTYDSEDSSPSYGQLLVDVEDYRLIDGLRDELQPWLIDNYPDASTKVWTFVVGPGGGSKIEAQFSGPDPAVLRDLANQAKQIMADAGAVAVKDDWREQVQVIRPVINDANARRLGLTKADISQSLYTHFTGANIGTFREGDELLDIVMRPVEAARLDANNLRDVQVFNRATGEYIPISQVVDRFEVVFEAGNLRRLDRQLTIMAQSDNPPGVLSGDLFEEVRAPIEAIEVPPGYSFEWKGEYGNSSEANAGLAKTMPLGFGAMILVVIFLFNAIRQPLIIFLTVPLALIGVIYGLVISGTPFEFMAILGLLSLTGMLIKNAIVLLDETDSQIGEGKARMQAIIDAAVSRVRPVILGVLTTVLGVVPLLWDPFFKSLAVAIIGGLSFATVLTLLFVPVLYAVFYRVKMTER